MKGDFTRFTFQPKKHYTGVYMQQGRLQLDSDWNEQVAIQKHLIQTYTKDFIGDSENQGSGAPGREYDEQNFAIKIIPDKLDFEICKGHLYVDGILCELDENTNYSKQFSPKELQTDLEGGSVEAKKGDYIAYIEVWERHVTGLEEPDITEIALNGLDTTTRTKTAWQVKLIKADKWQTFFDQNKSRKISLTAKTTEKAAFENRLYRIEIHQPGSKEKAQFKWSRDNGSIVFAVTKISDHVITVNSRGRDISQVLASGDWIEVIDEFRERHNQAGTLVKISSVVATSIEGGQLVVDLTTAIGPAVNIENYRVVDGPKTEVKVRRWDCDPTNSDKPLYSTNEEVVLDSGIKVKFDNTSSEYRVGDYWLLPVRANQQITEWPRLEAHGIHYHYLKLASATFNGKSFEVTSTNGQNVPDGFWKDERVLFISLSKCLNKDEKEGLQGLKKLSIGTTEALAALNVQGVDSTLPENAVIYTQASNKTTILAEGFDPKDLAVGGTIVVSDQTRTITEISLNGEIDTFKIDSDLDLPEKTKFVYQLPIARFADSSSTTQVIITAQGNLGVGTEAPTANLAVQGHSDQQPIARFSSLQNGQDQTRFIITAAGKLGVGTDAPEADLQVVGKLKTDILELPPQGTFETGTFIGSAFQVQDRSKQPFGSIQAHPLEGQGSKEIRFAANKDQDVNFAFLDGDIRIIKSGDTPASLRLNQGVAVTQFSNTFALPSGSDPATIVPTMFAVSDQLRGKAALNGSLEVPFNTQNLTVNGTLQFHQKGVAVTQFSNTFTLPLGSDPTTTVPTMSAVNTQLAGKADVHGSLNSAFNTQNLMVKGTLQFHQKGVGVTEFSNTFALTEGSNSQTIVPTIHAIAEYVSQQLNPKAYTTYVDQQLATKVDRTYVDDQLKTKAKKNGDSNEDFSIRDLVTRDLKVMGALTLLQGVKVNEFAAIDLNESAKRELAVPTAKATKDYVDSQLLTRANETGNNEVDFSAKNLTANSLIAQETRTNNLTISGNLIAIAPPQLEPDAERLPRLQVQGIAAKNDAQATFTNSSITSDEPLHVGDMVIIPGKDPRFVTQKVDNEYIISPPFTEDRDPRPQEPTTVAYQPPIASFKDDEGREQLTVTAQGTVVMGSLEVAPGGSPVTNEAKLYVNGKVFAEAVGTTQISQISSRTLKENIAELSSREVTELLQSLKPVKYSFKADQEETLHAGFISEDVPDLVASSDRHAINPVDIVAILTKAVQDQRQTTMVLADLVDRQQQEIRQLQEKINLLEEKSNNKSWFR